MHRVSLEEPSNGLEKTVQSLAMQQEFMNTLSTYRTFAANQEITSTASQASSSSTSTSHSTIDTHIFVVAQHTHSFIVAHHKDPPEYDGQRFRPIAISDRIRQCLRRYRAENWRCLTDILDLLYDEIPEIDFENSRVMVAVSIEIGNIFGEQLEIHDDG